jgi:hypothetical protein
VFSLSFFFVKVVCTLLDVQRSGGSQDFCITSYNDLVSIKLPVLKKYVSFVAK